MESGDVVLLNGPMEGTLVKRPHVVGARLELMEYQRCNRVLCHPHFITHEYDLTGLWLRSYSYLEAWSLLERD